MTKLYEIQFINEKRVMNELVGVLKVSGDILKMTQKSLVLSAYDLENRRKLINTHLKNKESPSVQEDDLLWAYYSPEETIRNQILFRSFVVKQIVYTKNKFTLIVDFTYEKSRQWFDLKENEAR